MEALSIANLKYTDVDKLQAKIDEYFKTRQEDNKPLTYASLGLVLGVDRTTLWRYYNKFNAVTDGNDNDDSLITAMFGNSVVDNDKGDKDSYKRDICNAVKKACWRVQSYIEDTIMTSKTPAGAIFLAKNYGYSDNQQLNVNTTVTHEVNPDQLEARITELLSKAIPDGAISLKEGDYEVT